MRAPLHLLLLLPLVAGCASSGSVPVAPLTWPPGTYYLEATVAYESGFGTLRDTYSGDLEIQPDGSMRLDNHLGGVCQDPTPQELRRDAEQRRRVFRCGDATYVLRPGMETVTGELRASVTEDYEVVQCVVRGSDGGCARTTRVARSRTVTKEASLRVRAVD